MRKGGSAMSQVLGPNDPFETYEKPSGSNPLGIVGFILSFCLSPIGLIISLIALTKQPRGFAIAGVIIGLLGTGVWGCVGFGWSVMQKIGGMSAFEITQDFEQIQRAANAATTDINSLGLAADVSTDPWGAPYRIAPSADASTFVLTSNGPDKLPDTADDLSVQGNMTTNEVMESLLQELMSRGGYAPPRSSTTTPPAAPAPAPEPAEEPAPKDETPAADQPE
jgi:hypothetical protein